MILRTQEAALYEKSQTKPMGKTLPYEHLEVGASEKSIQNILAFSKATKQLKLESSPKELGEIFKN